MKKTPQKDRKTAEKDKLKGAVQVNTFRMPKQYQVKVNYQPETPKTSSRNTIHKRRKAPPVPDE